MRNTEECMMYDDTNDEPSPFGSMKSVSSGSISLKSVSMKGTVEGLLFSSTIRQEYKNDSDEAVEIIYTFPVGHNTALLGMDAEIGSKRLHGEVVKNTEAEERYEGAIEKGDAAIMLQQSSLGLYTANLGNIAPNESVAVEIHCARLLSYDQGRIRIAIPTVIGERYGDPHAPGGLARHESAHVDLKARYSFRLTLTLKGDAANGEVSCPTHQVKMERGVDALSVTLDSNAWLDRDFVLLIQGLHGESQALAAPDHEKWMACASFCPHMENVENNPLGLKILVDCSGSMGGMSITQAQKGLQKIMRLLKAGDWVSYSRFGNDVKHLSKSMLPCESANMEKLLAAIEGTEADMGGTEMEAAVLSTIRDIANKGDVPPVMLLITDGDIWAVRNLIESAKKTGHRIFVLGVGAAPAESVLFDLATQTGGVCEFVTPNENMAEAIVRMFHRMRGKMAKNIRIHWEGQPVWQAEAPRYLYDGETAHTFALFDEMPGAGPTLAWEAGGQEHSVKVENMEKVDNADLARLGRACQMRESLTESEKLAIALKYQLISPLTSIILVYERENADKIKGMPKIQQVPQMPAYGHGNYMAMGFCASMAFDAPVAYSHIIAPQGPSWRDLGNKIFARAKKPRLIKAVADMLSLWKSLTLQLGSLPEFMDRLKHDKIYAPLLKIVDKLAKKARVSADSAWATLLMSLLEEDSSLDRHSMRLLKPFLPEEETRESLAEMFKDALEPESAIPPIIYR